MRLLVWISVGLVACTGNDDDGPVNQSDRDGDGVSSAEGDCDDQNAEIFPGAEDIVGDGVDSNCDQLDGVDADGDRDASQASGGADCDDEDPEINSEAEEIGWDGIDQNCDQQDQFDFVDICGGQEFTCGANTRGELFCWGDDADGVISNRPLDGRWVRVDCGNTFVCALEYDGSVVCWGDDSDGVVSDVPPVNALAVYTGEEHACIIQQSDSRQQCWGKPSAYAGGGNINVPIRDMALGGDYTCGVSNQFSIISCWGTFEIETNQDPIPNNSEWIKVSGGRNFVCGIGSTQNMDCFSTIEVNGADEPLEDKGPYSWVDTFDNWGCGIIEGNELTCWGASNNEVAQNGVLFGQPSPEVGLFRVGVGRRHACALSNETGEVVCWGDDTFGETVVPDFTGYAGTDDEETSK